MPTKKFSYYLPCLIGLIFGLFFFCLNITSSDFSKVPGDLGDARFNNYILEHAHLFFTGKTKEFWNAPFIYPEKNVIAYSDNLLGSAPFYSGFRLIGNNPQDAFQYWFILMALFNYLSCYLLLFYLFKNPYSAALGALIFAFSIALHSQVSHAQLFPKFAIPLSILAALAFLKDLKPIYFLLSLLALVYQFYCGIYLGFLLLVTLFFFYIVSLIYQYKILRTKIKESSWWLFMLSSVAINTLLMIPLMLPYVEKVSVSTVSPYWEVVNSVPSIRSFFYVHHGNYVWKFLEHTGDLYDAYWDHQIFPGGLALISFLLFVIIITKKYLFKKNEFENEHRTRMVVLLFTSLILFISFLRFQDYTIYRFIYNIPGFDSMRALQRIINIELLFFAIAFAFICNFIFKQSKTLNFIFFLVGLFIFYVDNSINYVAVDSYEKSIAFKRIETLNRKISHLKKGSIISYEPDTVVKSVIYYQLDAMISAQENEMICLNNYTSNPPDFYSYY
jgi:hypothetical protein